MEIKKNLVILNFKIIKSTKLIVNKFSATQAFDVLYSKNPKFHGRELAGSKNYAIRPKVLEWIINNIPTNANSLETGCGYTTVVLAALTKKHIVISPFNEEHLLIKEFCSQNNIHCQHVEMIAQLSQEVVPQLECDALDFILIDGDHAFPAPFIDWYYTADKLKVGGFLAVDDTQIPTGKILRDFLMMESNRWSLVTDIGNTAIFKRISQNNVAKDIMFVEQPYCKVPKKSLLIRIKNKLKSIVSK